MIGNTGTIQSKDFAIGLYTRSDIINPNPNLSPNCMDIQWFPARQDLGHQPSFVRTRLRLFDEVFLPLFRSNMHDRAW